MDFEQLFIPLVGLTIVSGIAWMAIGEPWRNIWKAKRLLRSGNWWERRQAPLFLAAASWWGVPGRESLAESALPFLMDALGDRDLSVRMNAMTSLVDIAPYLRIETGIRTEATLQQMHADWKRGPHPGDPQALQLQNIWRSKFSAFCSRTAEKRAKQAKRNDGKLLAGETVKAPRNTRTGIYCIGGRRAA